MYNLKRALPTTELPPLLRPQQQHICPLQGRRVKDRCQEGIMLAERWQNVGWACQLAHFLQSVSVSHQTPSTGLSVPLGDCSGVPDSVPGCLQTRSKRKRSTHIPCSRDSLPRTGACSSLGRCEKKTWQNTNTDSFSVTCTHKSLEKNWMRTKMRSDHFIIQTTLPCEQIKLYRLYKKKLPENENIVII